MDIEQIIEILRVNRSLLRQFHVSSLSIFGSVARGDPQQNSDIDILVEFEPGAAIGFFRFFAFAKITFRVSGQTCGSGHS